jgi:hypothetical protein
MSVFHFQPFCFSHQLAIQGDGLDQKISRNHRIISYIIDYIGNLPPCLCTLTPTVLSRCIASSRTLIRVGSPHPRRTRPLPLCKRAIKRVAMHAAAHLARDASHVHACQPASPAYLFPVPFPAPLFAGSQARVAAPPPRARQALLVRSARPPRRDAVARSHIRTPRPPSHAPRRIRTGRVSV